MFAAARTITLTSAPLTLTDAATTTITGTGAGLLTVSGNSARQVFVLNPGERAALSGLTVTGGGAPAFPGGGAFSSASAARPD